MLLACVGVIAADLFAQGSGRPLELDASKRYLVRSDGSPLLVIGDAAWSLIVQLSKEDASQYLESRRSSGFSLVMVNLIEHKFCSNAPRNFYGDAPFSGAAFTTPNEAYFAHADYVIAKAAQEGLVVLLAPIYLGYNCSDEGWCAEVQSATTSAMRQWGQYVGTRYKDYDNIIWMIGADTDPSPVKSKVREVVNGILDVDTRHLFTAHNQPESFALSPWSGESWLEINNVYTYSGTLYQQCETAYKVTPPIPYFMLEAAYEHEHGSTSQQLRAQVYWAVLSGAFGHVYGNCPMWHFGWSSSWCGLLDWKSELGSPGTRGMEYAGKLFRSRAWHKLLPDFDQAVMTSGAGNSTDYATTAYASDGSSIIAYLPSRRAITFTTSVLEGDSVRCWWYRPQDGSVTDVGTFAQGQITLEPPATGDWVLVADNAGLNLPPPGTEGGGGADVTASLRIFMKGPFEGTAMTTTLTTLGLIPLAQPYSGAPWNYAGSEAVGSIPSGVVDWVLVELRSDTSTVVGRRAAFILSNGTIVDTSGTGPVSFANLGAGNYYVVVYHRNHLAVMSASSIPLSATSALYDFSTAATQSYGTGGVTNLGGGVWGMWSGDANSNGAVTYTGAANDKNPILSLIGLSDLTNTVSGVYDRADLNLSGTVGLVGAANDKNEIFWTIGLFDLTSIVRTRVPTAGLIPAPPAVGRALSNTAPIEPRAPEQGEARAEGVIVGKQP